MAGTKISAEEATVGKVFSDEYQFTVPPYQRSYTWATEQAGELFDDLLTASLNQADPYFLGSIVLVKPEGQARAEIVDGQQRLATLTILFAALRDRAEALADDIGASILQQGRRLKGTVDQPRLRLRPPDQGFFEKYVQNPAAGTDQAGLIADHLPTDSQRHILLNLRLFLDRLDALAPERREALAQFIDRHTYLVVVATQDFESAYRIFTVLNERGLDLSHTDILKAGVVGELPDDDKAAYTAKWQAEEEALGRDGFADLFAHIRMVFAKTKARETILKEFRTSVLSRYPDSRAFIDDVLVPFSDAYEVVVNRRYPSREAAAGEIDQLLGWLDRLDNRDWVAPAISHLRRPDVAADQVARYLADLERLAASMFVRRVDITRRIERYGQVLEAMERGADLHAPGSPLQLSADERRRTIAGLDADIYNVTRIRLYVLLRLDSALAGAGATYDDSVITVEHVLPRNPAEGSPWRRWFTDEQRAEWTHRLANLVLLARRKNSQAGNFAFAYKQRSYFRMADGVSPFALTSQVLGQTEWTPEVLERRQRALLAKLIELWRL
jgi:hypothetical protein